MLRGTARDLILSTIALAALAPAVIGAAVSAHAAGSVIVHPKYGGYLLGFGVDPVGNDGLLSEYIALKTGKSFIATETFDRANGKIVKVIAKQNNTRDAYCSWGVFGPQVKVDEYYQARKKTFPVLNPLSGNTFNGAPDAVETFANAINSKGEIAGWYIDTNDTDHGFVRSR